MGGKGSSGPSASEMMQMQRTLQQEAFAAQEQASLRQEERAARRREEEREAELQRRRDAELEKAQKMAEEEKREGMIMAEAEAGSTDDDTLSSLNLDSPQIEAPDYAPDQELE